MRAGLPKTSIARKAICSEIIDGLVVVFRRVPKSRDYGLKPTRNPKSAASLSRLKGLRLRLMEPRTFEINCRGVEILFLCKLFIPKTGMETFFDGMREGKMESGGGRAKRRTMRRVLCEWWTSWNTTL